MKELFIFIFIVFMCIVNILSGAKLAVPVQDIVIETPDQATDWLFKVVSGQVGVAQDPDDKAQDSLAYSVRNLIENKANIWAVDGNGRTLLHWAAIKGFGGVVRVLLVEKVAVDVVDQWLWTPLHFAAFFGYGQVADLLVEYGADVALQTKDGRTPWVLAAAKKHMVLAKKLLDLLINEDVGEDENHMEKEDEALQEVHEQSSWARRPAYGERRASV